MTYRKTAVSALAVLGGFGCGQAPVDEIDSLEQRAQTPAAAAVVLGAEDPARWRAEAGPAPTTSSNHTEGAAAISVTPSSYTRYFSDAFPSAGAITEVKLDFFMAAQASQWKGNLELEMMCPSRNMNWEWIGQVPLTGKPEQQWFEASFPLSQVSQNKLFGANCDSLELRLIVNPGVGGTRFTFDNVRLLGLPAGAACALDADCESGNCEGGSCSASPAVPTFANIYFRDGEQFFYDIAPTSDGGYVISGFGGSVARLIKLDPLGSTVWYREYDSGADERGYVTCELPGGGYVVAGNQNASANWWYMWLARTDAQGNLLSATTIDDWEIGEILDVAPAPDGGLYVAGHGEINGVWPQAIVAKLDASDQVVWATNVSPEGLQADAVALTVASDGSVVVAGATYNPRNALLAKLSPAGALLWSRRFGADVYAEGRELIQTSDGGFLVGGLAAPNHAYVVKVSATGAEQWSAQPSMNRVWSVTEYGGEYSLIGSVARTAEGLSHVPRIATLSTSGVETFAADVRDPRLPGVASVMDGERTADGGWVMTGHFWDPAKEFVWDGFVAKTNAVGRF